MYNYQITIPSSYKVCILHHTSNFISTTTHRDLRDACKHMHKLGVSFVKCEKAVDCYNPWQQVKNIWIEEA